MSCSSLDLRVSKTYSIYLTEFYGRNGRWGISLLTEIKKDIYVSVAYKIRYFFSISLFSHDSVVCKPRVLVWYILGISYDEDPLLR